MNRILLIFVLFIAYYTSFSQNLNLRINEIMPSNLADTTDDFFEFDDWVEIYNPPGSGITNLAGYFISDDPDSLDKWMIPFENPGVTTVLPNNFIIFWIDDDYFNLNTQGPNHNAGFTLSADGETFLLTAPDATTIIDSVTYPVTADDISWGRSCDGCPNWQYFNNVTFEDNNFEIQTNDLLFINEVQTNNTFTYDDSQHEFDEWIEIYNPNAHQVNIANYYISNNGDPMQWQVPGTNPYRTVIPAGGFVLIWFDNDVADDVNHAPMSLDASGGTIVLTAPDGSTTTDTYTYPAMAENQSYGRQNDGSPSSIFFDTPTPTVTNQLIVIQPAFLVLNEVLSANQTDTIDNYQQHSDWFEVYNPNNFDINIGGYYFSDNPEQRNKWKVPTDFPDSVKVEALSWLLFWADNDENQGVHHSNFKLSNNGEYLGFFSPDGYTVADEIEWGYIAPDTSYGRATDGAANWILFVGTTPEYSNNAGIINIIESEMAAFSAYPNPAQERIFFKTTTTVDVYSMSGSKMESHRSVNMIDISSWATGAYILRNSEGQCARIMKN